MSWFSSNPLGDDRADEELPNGHTRGEYHERGFSDEAIDDFGLNQPGAPGPNVAGWEIADFMDGDYDGEIDL